MTPSAPALQIQTLADGRFRVGHAMFDDRADARGYLLERFGITPGEIPIIECLARGLQYKQIAVECGLAIKTIEAHFATFPQELAKRCILAGCPPGGTVLDPFAGSGTVGHVAQGLGNSAVLIEASADYCNLIEKRCAQRSLLEALA